MKQCFVCNGEGLLYCKSGRPDVIGLICCNCCYGDGQLPVTEQEIDAFVKKHKQCRVESGYYGYEEIP